MENELEIIVQGHLSDEQFLTILRKNGGLFSRTARAIVKEYGGTYTRQAVEKRARNFPDIIYDINEENIDIAEEGLYTLIRSENESIRLRAIELLLRTRGRKRGYVEKSELEVSGEFNITMDLK